MTGMAEVLIRAATIEDAVYVGKHLRRADADEIMALGEDPEKMVRYCVRASDEAMTAVVAGVPVMVFGCSRSMLSEWGEVWALGTDECTKHPREMLIFGRSLVRAFLEKYPKMMNYCDARYARALKWLKKIGFTVHPPAPYGPKGMQFCLITAEKEI